MRPRRLSPAVLEHILTHARPHSDRPTNTKKNALLRLLLTVNRQLLNRVLVEQFYQRGDVLFWEGERGDAMYLIRAGRVVVLKGDPETPTVLGYRGPGEIIGEMALLESQTRSATNVALSELRLLRIDRNGFRELIRANPDISLTIMSMLSARLRVADTIRTSALVGGKQLQEQVSRLMTEKEQLLELQRVRKETSDLIVHDLRNPLGVIYGALNMLEMVLPEDVLEDNRELIDLASSACERMQRLVDSLLDVAKLETGEMSINLRHADLQPIVEEVAQLQSVNARPHNVTIRTEIPHDLPSLLLDVEKIERVLSNLLDNALKYSPPDSTITVRAERIPQGVAVSVIDQGPGVPEEQRERIFERFAQVEGSKPARRGFGLGLTFCRLAVEAHGGKIWAEEGLGGMGSRFVFTLPVEG